MDIHEHRFPAYWHALSPNTSGPLAAPRYVVIHYTAGGSAEAAVRWLMNPDAPGKPSAHLLIGRDGSIRQIVPFNLVANHAGRSAWKGITGLNRYSLGIELANVGPLTPQPDGSFRDSYGHPVPAGEGILAAHKNGGPVRGWQVYPAAQLEALERVLEALLAQYPTLEEIIGHDDIAPGRKSDPGPAFPMARFARLAERRAAAAVAGAL